MTAETNKALVRNFYESVGRADAEAAAATMAAECIHYFAGMPPLDVPAFKQMVGMFFSAFPDFRVTIEDLVAEDGRVAMRSLWRGTHQGELMGVPPTGKAVTVLEQHIFRIADGKIAEHWSVMDQMGLMQQLGAIPVPGQSQ